MQVPGLNVVSPSSPVDVVGLLAAAVRDPDPVIFLEHKSLYATKGEVPDGEIVDTLGTAKILRAGTDCTLIALGMMVPRALAAAELLASEAGISCEVVRSEEHTSELPSLMRISYAVFCMKKQTTYQLT